MMARPVVAERRSGMDVASWLAPPPHTMTSSVRKPICDTFAMTTTHGSTARRRRAGREQRRWRTTSAAPVRSLLWPPPPTTTVVAVTSVVLLLVLVVLSSRAIVEAFQPQQIGGSGGRRPFLDPKAAATAAVDSYSRYHEFLSPATPRTRRRRRAVATRRSPLALFADAGPSSGDSSGGSSIDSSRSTSKKETTSTAPSPSSSSSSLLPPKKKQQQQRRPSNRSRSSGGKSKGSSNNAGNNSHRVLNGQLTQCQDAKELLQLLSRQRGALTERGGGGVLNSINFSTAVHRLARHSIGTYNNSNRQQQQQQQRDDNNSGGGNTRASVLTDPRFALFLASLAEALADSIAGNDKPSAVDFQSRELSNAVWALAKLKLAPPSSAMPLAPIVGADLDDTSAESVAKLLDDAAQTVREQVLRVAAQRRQQQGQPTSRQQQQQQQQLWIPALSQLAGRVLDAISYQVLKQSTDKQSKRRPFQMQEYANLLWAWATASRVYPVVYDVVLQNMMERQRRQLELSKSGATPSSSDRALLPPKNQKHNKAEGELKPQEWSNSMWACATAQVYQPDLLSFVAELLADNPSFADQFKTQELSNTVWGVATMLSNACSRRGGDDDIDGDDSESVSPQDEVAALTILRVMSQSLIRRAHEFRTQELSNTAWALATLGFGLNPISAEKQSLNSYIVLNSEHQEEDARLMQSTVDAIVGTAMTILPRFRSQELNNLAWSLARLLGDRPEGKTKEIEDLLRGIGLQLCNPRRSITSQDISATLWSLSTLEFRDADIYEGIVARLGPDFAKRAKPQELSISLWAVASADIDEELAPIMVDRHAFDTSMVAPEDRPQPRDPITKAFGLAAVELMRRPYDFKPQELKDVLWSFSKIEIRHPNLFKTIAEHLVGENEESSNSARGFASFSPQGLGNLAWAYARQAQLAAEAPTEARRNAASTLAQSTGRLAVYTASYFDIGEVLLHRLFRAIAEAAIVRHDNLRNLKPQDLSNLAWTYAVLGLSHRGFKDKAKDELRMRLGNFLAGDTRAMNSFKGQELANLLWGMATLNVPAGELLETFTPYFCEICQDSKGKVTPESIAGMFKRQELANIAWSCAVFGTYTNELMRLLYSGLVGVGDQQLPSVLCKAHGDTGLQSQAIMSLIYVQAMIDLESKSEGLTLPTNFPDGWQQAASSEKDDHATETIIELNLSTSKIQRAVSSAFHRIGFDHVEEHIITMADMANQGVSFTPNEALQILSIDIANLENKIAIEVDGPAHFICRIDDVSDSGGHTRLVNGKLEYQYRWDGDKQQINGATALKQRLLSLLGWQVVHLPFWEWYALGTDEAAQDAYCQQLLKR